MAVQPTPQPVEDSIEATNPQPVEDPVEATEQPTKEPTSPTGSNSDSEPPATVPSISLLAPCTPLSLCSTASLPRSPSLTSWDSWSSMTSSDEEEEELSADVTDSGNVFTSETVGEVNDNDERGETIKGDHVVSTPVESTSNLVYHSVSSGISADCSLNELTSLLRTTSEEELSEIHGETDSGAGGAQFQPMDPPRLTSIPTSTNVVEVTPNIFMIPPFTEQQERFIIASNHPSKEMVLQKWDMMLKSCLDQFSPQEPVTMSRTSSEEELRSIFGLVDEDNEPQTPPCPPPPSTTGDPSLHHITLGEEVRRCIPQQSCCKPHAVNPSAPRPVKAASAFRPVQPRVETTKHLNFAPAATKEASQPSFDPHSVEPPLAMPSLAASIYPTAPVESNRHFNFAPITKEVSQPSFDLQRVEPSTLPLAMPSLAASSYPTSLGEGNGHFNFAPVAKEASQPSFDSHSVELSMPPLAMPSLAASSYLTTLGESNSQFNFAPATKEVSQPHFNQHSSVEPSMPPLAASSYATSIGESNRHFNFAPEATQQPCCYPYTVDSSLMGAASFHHTQSLGETNRHFAPDAKVITGQPWYAAGYSSMPQVDPTQSLGESNGNFNFAPEAVDGLSLPHPVKTSRLPVFANLPEVAEPSLAASTVVSEPKDAGSKPPPLTLTPPSSRRGTKPALLTLSQPGGGESATTPPPPPGPSTAEAKQMWSEYAANRSTAPEYFLYPPFTPEQEEWIVRIDHPFKEYVLQTWFHSSTQGWLGHFVN